MNQLYAHIARAARRRSPGGARRAAARASRSAPASTRPRAATAIGWRPEVALADGLARTFEWFAARRGKA